MWSQHSTRGRRIRGGSAAFLLLIVMGCEDGGRGPLAPGAPVATVEVHPASASLAEFESRALEAKPKSSDGRVVPGNSVTWSSSDSTIAVVDARGFVTARREGQVVITASSAGKTGRSTITIGRAPVASVEIHGDSVRSLYSRESVQLIALPKDAQGNTLNMRPPTWRSSDEEVAWVTSTGGVVARRYGEAYVSAEVEGVTARVLIRVRSGVHSIEIDPLYLFLDVGEVQLINAVARTEGDHVLNRPVTWTVEDPRIVSIDRGRVRGLRAGTTVLTATLDDRSAQARVTVHERRDLELRSLDGSILPATVHESTYQDADGRTRTHRWELADGRLLITGGNQRYERQLRFRIFDDGEYVQTETMVDRGSLGLDLTTMMYVFRSDDGGIPSGRGREMAPGEFTLLQRDARGQPERTYVFRER